MPIRERFEKAPLTIDDRGAIFSPCRKWRYLLWRRWTVLYEAPILVFIMLNPSIANVEINDPTVERCERRARRLGYGGVYVANAFGIVATNPEDMLRDREPVGPDNDKYIRAAIRMARDTCGTVVVAWGSDGNHRGRAKEVIQLAKGEGVQLQCLGYCKDGSPRHPLYIRNDAEFAPWPKLFVVKKKPLTKKKTLVLLPKSDCSVSSRRSLR